MSNDYRPPRSISMPFRFTNQGYVQPSSSEIAFRFSPSWKSGDIQASINVLKLYQDETYTYIKSCPKYLIGYESGIPQLIDGRCVFGGIRDLGSTVIGHDKETPGSNLPSYINGVRLGSFSNLSANCTMDTPRNITAFVGAHFPSDISAELIGSRLSGYLDLESKIDTHVPTDIGAYIGTHIHSDIDAQLNGMREKGLSNISSIIGTHLPENLTSYIGIGYAGNLLARIIGIDRGHYDLQGIIGGVKKTSYGNILSYIDVHYPNNISASIRMFFKDNYDLGGYLWPAHERYLQANVDTHMWKSLYAHISGGGDGFDDLLGYLNVEKRKGLSYLQSSVYLHLPRDLGMSVTGVKSDGEDLSSFLHALHIRGLYSNINVHYPEILRASIRGWKTTYRDILSSLRSWHRLVESNISGIIGTHLPENITSFIDTHTPVDLTSLIGGHLYGQLMSIVRAWHIGVMSDITSKIYGWQQGNITSNIGCVYPRNLRVYIRSWVRGEYEDLKSTIKSWVESPNLGSEISIHTPSNIKLIIRGWSRDNKSDLGMYIHPWELRDISSSIETHMFDELKSSIRPWYFDTYKDLSSRLGVWHDRYISASVDTHMWVNLVASVLPHITDPLNAVIKGWFINQSVDLISNVYGWGQGNLSALSGGHLYGMLNIIMKGVAIGVIRNLPSNLYGWQDSNLGAVIGSHLSANLGMLLKGVVIGEPYNIPANIYGWQKSDLGVITKGGHLPVNLVGHVRIYQSFFNELQSGIYGWQVNNLSSLIDTHIPINITSNIRPWYRNIIKNLYGSTYGWQEIDIKSEIGTHSPSNLGVILKVLARINKNIKGVIYGWQEAFLGLRLGGTHNPDHLLSELYVKQRGIGTLNVLIHAWHKLDLGARLNIVFFRDIMSLITPVPPDNLSAYVNIISSKDLNAYSRVWDVSYLSAEIDQIYHDDLIAVIRINSEPYRNLLSRIHVSGFGDVYLAGRILPLHHRSLSASVRATYLSDLSLSLFAIAPKDISAFIHAWQIKDLSSFIEGTEYPWNLKAYISGSGGFSGINAYIFSIKVGGVFRDLIGRIHVFEPRSLGAEISVEPAILLGAYINPFMLGRNLTANIRPKMIRLTTLVSVSTLMKNDLSAIINYPCFKTGYSNISANIYSKFKSELQGIIFALRYEYKPYDLKSSLGFSDYILNVDKLNLRINIFPNEFFTEDVHRINLRILSGYSAMSAFIKCTLNSVGLSASVFGNKIPKYTFDSLFKNRERVVNMTYDGVFKSYEVVELSFSSAVKDYYYSSQGDYAWSQDRFDKWMLAVRSYIPADLALKLNRRLHKATKVYDLRKFVSIDDAIKFAISYVTEYPTSNLLAEVVGSGSFEYLSGTINPRYTKKSINTLFSEIIPIDSDIIVKTSDSIIKL